MKIKTIMVWMEVIWVWREEKEGGRVWGLEAPAREVGGVWEGFDDEVEDE